MSAAALERPGVTPELRDRRNRAIDFNNDAVRVVPEDRQTAYRLLCSAVTVDPTFAQGWYGLGNALVDLKHPRAAVACFRRALALADGALTGDMTPDLRAKCTINLAHWLMNVGELDEALRMSDAAIEMVRVNPRIDPEGAQLAWTNKSLILSQLGRDEEALRFAEEGYRLHRQPMQELGLAFALMHGGDYAKGLRHFESRFPWKLHSYLNYPYPRWRGGRVGVLLAASEQGMGDCLSVTRFVGEAASRVGRVIYMVQAELVRLFRMSLPWKNVEVIPLSTQFPVADAWCPAMSLPVAMGLTTEQVRDREQGWVPVAADVPGDWKSPTARLHVGIAYAGEPGNDIDRWRSIGVAEFMRLYECPGVQLYSLQVGERVKDLHDEGLAGLVRDLSGYIRDASDTVALVRHLDLVVTVESFMGHLAGAVGMDSWVLASMCGGDWRLGRSGTGSLWYPRTRVFRQGKPYGWDVAFGEVVAALRERVDVG